MFSNTKITKNNIVSQEKTLCSYQNYSTKWQIVKITNIPNYHLEKVVLPKQRIIFSAFIEAKLEIFYTEQITGILADTISCQKMKIN